MKSKLAAILASAWIFLAASSPRAADKEDDASEASLFSLWLRSGKEVAAFRSQIGAARFDIITASVYPNPQLALATSTVVTGKDHPPDGIYNFGPQITFALPIFGQLSARKSVASASLKAAEVNVLESLWNRASDIKEAMVQRAFADAGVKAIQKNLDELQQLIEVVKTRTAAGATSRYDVLRAATTESTFRAALANAQIDLANAEASLVGLMAIPGVSRAPIAVANLAAYLGTSDKASMIDLALLQRPDIILARQQSKVSEAQVARLRRENFPIPSVYVGTYHTLDYPSVSVQAGVSFTLPVFDRNQGPIGRVLAEGQGNQTMIQALELRIRSEVSGAWASRNAAIDALKQFQSVGLTDTGELLERASVSYKNGVFSILDLLDAYRTVWEARAQELELKKTLAEAEAALDRAVALGVWRSGIAVNDLAEQHP